MDVFNDPRMFGDSVFKVRLGALSIISFCSVFMGQNACTQMLKLNSKEGSLDVGEFVALCVMGTSFVINMGVVVVVVQQVVHITRLATLGPTGFEFAKSYYLNRNVAAARHLCIDLFQVMIPVFVFGMALLVWENVDTKGERRLALPVIAVMCMSGLCFICTQWETNKIFNEKYRLSKIHERPLMEHLNVRHHTSEIVDY